MMFVDVVWFWSGSLVLFRRLPSASQATATSAKARIIIAVRDSRVKAVVMEIMRVLRVVLLNQVSSDRAGLNLP